MRPGWNAQEDAALVVAPEQGEGLPGTPPPPPVTPGEWMKVNLFSSPFNTILTLAVGLLSGWLAFALLRWFFVTADWTVVRVNMRLFMVGRFPIGEVWRVWVAVYYVAVLSGITWGWSGRRMRWDRLRVARRVIGTILGILLLLFLVESPLVISLAAAAVGAVLAGALLGRSLRGRPSGRRLVRAGWLLAFPFIIFILQAFGGVGPLRWGGFLLNVLVAVVGIVISFPIGMALALGRRSSFPAVRVVCVGMIEFVRGAPLYTWLLFGQFLLPFLLPPGVRLPQIVRAMMMFTLFSSAYVAEIVRGGLQGVHHGQFEASRALGLSTTRMMALIVLPQALRNTIPAMISHFISLFKDTSLLAIVGFIEVLRVARVASAAAQFVGTSKQTLLFAAFIFWIVAFSMSRWSQRLELRLGVGER